VLRKRHLTRFKPFRTARCLGQSPAERVLIEQAREVAIQQVREPLARLAERSDSLAQRARNIAKALRPEDQERERNDQPDVGDIKPEHGLTRVLRRG
jgi:hypothetical protein